MYKLSKRSKKRLEGINEELITVVELALTISKVDFGIPQYGGLRTAEDQKALYDRGSSKADGYKYRSRHQTGLAVDVFAYVNGKASWEEAHLTHIATAMLQAASQLGVKLKWGGLWRSFRDLPHFEVVG